MSFPEERPRRLRRNSLLRGLVSEVTLSPKDLVLPVFVSDAIATRREVPTMPGVFQETPESLVRVAEEVVELGIPGMILFGIPAHKDQEGSSAWDDQGVIQTALRGLRAAVGDRLLLIADDCLDEFTDHGHCGVLTAAGEVDNDATIALADAVSIPVIASGGLA